MPIHVEKSIDDPIITFTFEGEIDPETVEEASTQLAEAVETMGTLYVVLDLRSTEMTQGEAIALIESPDTSSLVSHPRIRLVFVGDPVPHDPTKPFQAQVFSNEDDALDYIHQEIARNAPHASGS
jgi:hypothetical protein